MHYILVSLLFLSSCATKYLVPQNRFITPESQGGFLRGQVELQYTKATQVMIFSNEGEVDDISLDPVPRSGFMLANSFADSIDFIWSHNGSANSMVGLKVQFLGASRTGKGTGHKLAGAFLMGGNRHETRDGSYDFRVDGQEFLIIYGYRMDEILMPYVSVGSASYGWKGKIKGSMAPPGGSKITSNAQSLNLGLSADWPVFFLKAELSYQKLEAVDYARKANINLGLAGGINW